MTPRRQLKNKMQAYGKHHSAQQKYYFKIKAKYYINVLIFICKICHDNSPHNVIFRCLFALELRKHFNYVVIIKSRSKFVT
jgi:hypothetical protein